MRSCECSRRSRTRWSTRPATSASSPRSTGLVRKSAQPAFMAWTASRTSSWPVTATASSSGIAPLGLAHQADAVQPRHHDVGDQQVEVLLAEERQRLLRRAGRAGGVAGRRRATSRKSSWKKGSSSTTRMRPVAIYGPRPARAGAAPAHQTARRPPGPPGSVWVRRPRARPLAFPRTRGRRARALRWSVRSPGSPVGGAPSGRGARHRGRVGSPAWTSSRSCRRSWPSTRPRRGPTGRCWTSWRARRAGSASRPGAPTWLDAAGVEKGNLVCRMRPGPARRPGAGGPHRLRAV